MMGIFLSFFSSLNLFHLTFFSNWTNTVFEDPKIFCNVYIILPQLDGSKCKTLKLLIGIAGVYPVETFHVNSSNGVIW